MDRAKVINLEDFRRNNFHDDADAAWVIRPEEKLKDMKESLDEAKSYVSAAKVYIDSSKEVIGNLFQFISMAQVDVDTADECLAESEKRIKSLQRELNSCERTFRNRSSVRISTENNTILPFTSPRIGALDSETDQEQSDDSEIDMDKYEAVRCEHYKGVTLVVMGQEKNSQSKSLKHKTDIHDSKNFLDASKKPIDYDLGSLNVLSTRFHNSESDENNCHENYWGETKDGHEKLVNFQGIEEKENEQSISKANKLDLKNSVIENDKNVRNTDPQSNSSLNGFFECSGSSNVSGLAQFSKDVEQYMRGEKESFNPCKMYVKLNSEHPNLKKILISKNLDTNNTTDFDKFGHSICHNEKDLNCNTMDSVETSASLKICSKDEKIISHSPFVHKSDLDPEPDQECLQDKENSIHNPIISKTKSTLDRFVSSFHPVNLPSNDFNYVRNELYSNEFDENPPMVMEQNIGKTYSTCFLEEETSNLYNFNSKISSDDSEEKYNSDACCECKSNESDGLVISSNSDDIDEWQKKTIIKAFFSQEICHNDADAERLDESDNMDGSHFEKEHSVQYVKGDQTLNKERFGGTIGEGTFDTSLNSTSNASIAKNSMGEIISSNTAKQSVTEDTTDTSIYDTTSDTSNLDISDGVVISEASSNEESSKAFETGDSEDRSDTSLNSTSDASITENSMGEIVSSNTTKQSITEDTTNTSIYENTSDTDNDNTSDTDYDNTSDQTNSDMSDCIVVSETSFNEESSNACEIEDSELRLDMSLTSIDNNYQHSYISSTEDTSTDNDDVSVYSLRTDSSANEDCSSSHLSIESSSFSISADIINFSDNDLSYASFKRALSSSLSNSNKEETHTKNTTQTINQKLAERSRSIAANGPSKYSLSELKSTQNEELVLSESVKTIEVSLESSIFCITGADNIEEIPDVENMKIGIESPKIMSSANSGTDSSHAISSVDSSSATNRVDSSNAAHSFDASNAAKSTDSSIAAISYAYIAAKSIDASNAAKVIVTSNATEASDTSNAAKASDDSNAAKTSDDSNAVKSIHASNAAKSIDTSIVAISYASTTTKFTDAPIASKSTTPLNVAKSTAASIAAKSTGAPNAAKSDT